MRRLVPALLLVAAPVAAQTTAPDVTSLAGALSLRGALEASSRHGCSQSYATSSHQADLRLDVDTHDAVTLVIDQRTSETFGPSPLRMGADREPTTHTTELTRLVLRGRATRTRTSVDIVLTSAERASVRFEGYGTAPLPPGTSTPLRATLRCWTARADVLPSRWPQGAAPTTRSVLECALDDVPAPLDRFEAGPIFFGHGAGFLVRTESPMFSDTPARSIHVAQ